MSSVVTLCRRRTSYSASPKSSPTGPTGRTSVKKLAASEKCTAEPPSARSRSPKGVLIASKAIDPTTVSDMAAGSVADGGLQLARRDPAARRERRALKGGSYRDWRRISRSTPITPPSPPP
jgi:hypothetical protein